MSITIKIQSELEQQEKEGLHLEGWERELVRYRFVMQRTLILSNETKTAPEMIRLVKAAGTAAIRISRILMKNATGQAEQMRALLEWAKETEKEERKNEKGSS